MQGKNSFVLYTELIEVVEELNDEEAGLLFKTILRYVNDKNPVVPSQIKLAFIPIKQDLKRDLDKWKDTISKRSEAGKKHKGNQYTNNIENGTNGTSVPKMEQMEQNGTNGTVNVNDNVNVNVNVNDINNTISGNPTLNARCINDNFNSFWKEYPKKIGKDKCLKWFKIHKPDDALVCKMVQTIKTFKESTQWEDKQYIPYPYTWLNRGGWDDEVELSKYNTGNYSISNQWEEL